MARKYDEDEIIGKVGGRFKLASLLEKRYKELLFGARPLVEVDSNDPLDILLTEVVEGKIELIPESDAIAAAAAILMADRSDEAREEMKAREELEARQKREIRKKDEDEDEEK